MDQKRLIHAVAGSGKTRTIIDDLNIEKRNLIITYTKTNQDEIRHRIIQRFGQHPDRTHVFGVFEFMYSFCLKPYHDKQLVGIDFNYQSKSKYDTRHFNGERVIHSRLASFLLKQPNPYYLERIDKFFDCIYIDEVQDFESHDFEWVKTLARLNAKVWLLGDFYQKTFSTSRDGNKGSGVHKDINKWLKELSVFELDNESLAKSHRCPAEVCNFVRENIDIPIYHSEENNTTSNIVLVEDDATIERLMLNDEIKKLFYQKYYDYNCNGQNWGDSKGKEYSQVCVILNKTTMKLYKKNQLSNLASKSKNKFYVACTRTMGDLYFISEDLVKRYKKK